MNNENCVMNVENVSFSYKKKKMVLSDINVKFEKSKIYSILGHNGAGKTTLIRLCLNILKISSGKISSPDFTELAYVPDYGGLFNFLTVYQNINVFLDLNVSGNENKEKFIIERLNKWQLHTQKDTLVKNLSMGQKQRLSLLIASINDPDILFFDEPSNSIDINSQKLLQQCLLELKNKGKTIIIATHDLDLIKNVSDQCLILHNHKLVYFGSEIDEITSIYKKLTEDEANENN